MNFKLWWRNKATKEQKNREAMLAEKCADLEHSLKRSQERFRCLVSILKSLDKPMSHEFHTTSKGIPVLLCMDAEGREISVYNLNSNPEANCMLRLKAVYMGNEAVLMQIAGGVRLGHGSLAVNSFLNHCRTKGIEKVSTQFMAIEDKVQKDLLGFFSSCGFSVTMQVGTLWDMEILLKEKDAKKKLAG